MRRFLVFTIEFQDFVSSPVPWFLPCRNSLFSIIIQGACPGTNSTPLYLMPPNTFFVDLDYEVMVSVMKVPYLETLFKEEFPPVLTRNSPSPLWSPLVGSFISSFEQHLFLKFTSWVSL